MEQTHSHFLLHEVAKYIDGLESQKADLIDALETAIARVELANAEGDDILSAWLPDAVSLVAGVRNA